MTTHYAEFDVGQAGLSLTVELFAPGNDTILFTATGSTAQTNRIGAYRSSFTNVTAGFYELRARVGSTPRAVWNVMFKGTDNEVVQGTINGVDIDGYTLEEFGKLALAAVAGKLSGGGTTTEIMRAADDSKARITAVVDSSGNRTSVSLDATG